MPKRILDDSLLSSPSLAKCSPRAQDAFPRFILLMDDFGCAEANPRRLLGAGWALRDDVTERDVWAWLEEYVAAGMACLWTEKERRWVHLTGWNGPHGQRKRAEYDPAAPEGTAGRHGSKRKTPRPPPDLVAAVMAGARRDVDGKPPGVDREEAPEKLPEITPARESTGKPPGPAREASGSRVVPAHAVAVAVPDLPPTRARATPVLVSPFPAGQDPAPNVTAVLAALHERGVPDAAPPSARSEATVEAAIASVGVEAAVQRLLAVYANPEAQRPLTYHTQAILGRKRVARRGDLGVELDRWQDHLTTEQRDAWRREAVALCGPDFADAPIGVSGTNRELVNLNERYRQIAAANGGA